MNDKLKHKNIRWMAWTSLFAGFAYVPLMAWIPELASSAPAFWGFCGAVITFYMTNSNVRDGWGKQ